jgi:hypothetical protein
MSQCEAFTQKGTQCSRNGQDEYNGYCWQHHRIYYPSQYEHDRCKAICLTGNRCKRIGPSITGKGYCWQHIDKYRYTEDEQDDTTRCCWDGCLNLSYTDGYCKTHLNHIFDVVKIKYNKNADGTAKTWTKQQLINIIKYYNIIIEDGSIKKFTKKQVKTSKNK